MTPTKNLNSQLSVIYDTYRTATLNKLYYGALLARYQKINTWIEVAIAFGATSSGISGFSLWKIEPYGPTVWAIYAGFVAVLAVVKPFLQLPKKIERYTKLHTAHLYNALTLFQLVEKIRHRRELTEETNGRFDAALQQHIEISRDDDPVLNKKILSVCEAAVRAQIPESSLWWAAHA